ncbi:MAG: gluconeogenesis factor YvcK family protein [bacterium]|nr:gluconeogenesis factor YvcK family protein [bacterium]
MKKWFVLGLGVKRWVFLLIGGILLTSLGLALALVKFIVLGALPLTFGFFEIGLVMLAGAASIALSLYRLSKALLAPYRRHQQGAVIDLMYTYSRRAKGIKVVAIGGGTGLPASLRGLKSFTSNITAVVTVADDGGSSGRLRREMGVLPPGDLRNNIAALADDESLMTQLFQYRFKTGDLSGHAFGNLFISALSGVTGSLESALIETERVLNIQGRVLPATLTDVNLGARILLPDERRTVTVEGESAISETGGAIEQIWLIPEGAAAYEGSVRAILEADLVVIGPGSLYTSILPNMLVRGIGDALRATSAFKVYVCNIAQQPGETDGYTLAEHVLALERHIGRGVFQAVIANNVYPSTEEGENRNTQYVYPAPEHHEILQRYHIHYTDLVDARRPWRHDAEKLGRAIVTLSQSERKGVALAKPVLAHV